MAAYRNGITPILCVGEALDVREAGGQLAALHAPARRRAGRLPAEQAESIVIAYEPVWAIGTGEVATPDDAQEVCAAIRGRLGGAVLAGTRRPACGSSTAGRSRPTNAAEILAQPDIDGALVGGASLDGDEFAGICLAARPATTRR